MLDRAPLNKSELRVPLDPRAGEAHWPLTGSDIAAKKRTHCQEHKSANFKLHSMDLWYVDELSK